MTVPPLAIGSAAGALMALALALPTMTALDALAEARATHEAVAAEAAAPPAPLVADALTLRGGSRDRAGGLLAARIRALAARGGVLVETVEPAGGDGLVRLRLRLSGSEGAVLALADTMERGPSLVRFRSWRIEPAGDGVRLSGEMVAPWR